MSTAHNSMTSDQFWKHYFELQSLAMQAHMQGGMFSLTVKNEHTGQEEQFQHVRFLPDNLGTKN